MYIGAVEIPDELETVTSELQRDLGKWWYYMNVAKIFTFFHIQ